MAFELTDAEFERIKREFPWPDSTCPTCGNALEYKLNGEVRECNCRQQKTLAQHYYKANIPRRYHSLTLDEYVMRYRQMNPGVVEQIEEYIDGFDLNYHYGRGLAMQGPHGTGKTMLAIHILKRVIVTPRKYRGFFMQFTDVINTWGGAWKDAESKEMLERNLKRADLLVLDDIISDKRNSEGFLQAGLEAVLRSRHNNSLPTILTTNMSERELEKEFPRAYSVISGVTHWLTLEGPDYRPENIKEIESLIEDEERLPVR